MIDFTKMLETTRDVKANGWNPLEYIRAHQYLYYVLAVPVLSDHEYDKFVRWTCLDDGKGGSDRADDYTMRERMLARRIRDRVVARYPDCYDENA